MSITTGLIDTGGSLADELVVDMSDLVHKRQVDRAEFKTMLEKLGRKPAIREKVEWLEEDLVPRISALAASATSAQTALNVTAGHGNTVFREFDVVRNMETGEGYLVTSVSANSIGVTRGWGGAPAASSSSAAQLLIVGNAAAAGAASGTAQYVPRVLGFNYVQDQRNPMWFTDRQTDIAHYSGDEPERELVRKLDEHLRAIETTLFFGTRDFDGSASPGARGSCGGAIEFISSNVLDANGALTPSEFETWLENPYSVSGRGNKVLFVAPRVATVFSQMYRDKWQPAVAGDDRVYGAKVSAFIHATFGMSIPVFVKREWSDFDKTGTNYGTYGFLIDLDHVRLRVLNGRFNQLRKNIQQPDTTAEAHEYRSVFSLEFGAEQAHGVIRGVTSYSAT